MQKFLGIVCALGMAGGGVSECFAATAEAQVSTRAIADGTRVVFAWDKDKDVPFTLDSSGDRVMLHFAKPVTLNWEKSLTPLHPYIRQVETVGNGATVILTLTKPEDTRYFMSYGKNGIDLIGTHPVSAASKMPVTTMSARKMAAVKKPVHAHVAAKASAPKKVVAQVALTPAPVPAPTVAAAAASAAPSAQQLVALSPQPGLLDVTQLAQLSPAAGTPAPAAVATPLPAAPPAAAVPLLSKSKTDALVGTTGDDTLFPYAHWKLKDDKDFVPTERKLFNDIAYGTMDGANKARLRLLDLYLAEGLFPEARGMSDDILRSSLKFYTEHKIAALRGVSYFFMYRIADAERDFSMPELQSDPEIKLWRGLCKELLGEEHTDTFSFTGNYERYIHSYPPVFIQKLAVISADLSINRKDYETANAIFDILKRDNLDEPVKKYVDYMRAKVLSETKSEEEAAKIWERQAKEIDDPLIRARAEFSLVNMLLREDKIDHEEAIKRLDRLRIVWRGDNLELSVLILLGNLYAEDNQYAKALHTLRDIVLYYPEVPEAVTAAKKMEEIFVGLYNKGTANSMPPLEALSLFYEFRDLVPVGKEGDQMIRNLADRLVDIDLLDRAATLLDHQIRKRLDGEERSRVGARLALIYLMNHQPKEALETLKTTGYGDLPPDLQLTRLHLTAQALAQQNQPAKAIDVLSSDNSSAGNALRLSIYWDNKDWPNVVSTAEEILSNRNDPSAALSPQESDILLKLATAYVYEHDTGQIQYLRDYFTPLLKKNASKDSFLFITSESGTIDYENLANLNQDITEVKSFLDTYRDTVKKNGLSKAIN